MKKIFLPFLIFIISSNLVQSQDKTDYTKLTFYCNRIINGHSVETTPAGKLELKIGHRMGRINGGAYEFFGLDQSTSRIGLEYGLTNRFMIGAGRNTNEKLVDGFFKYKILQQSTGKVNMPFSLSFLSSAAVNTIKWTDTTKKDFLSSRLCYTFQLLAARKFSDKLSLQIMPTIVHKNLVPTTEDNNDLFSVGFAAKYNLFSRGALMIEYYYLLPDQFKSKYNGSEIVNSFSIGFDIYTGKHTFQIFLTNSTTMAEKAFITETTETWKKGNFHIGFNINRLFTVVNK
jgi:hypothetical protein